MPGPGDETEAIALFSMQMLVHVVRNLVSTGTMEPDGMKVNIEQTRTHLASFHPHHSAVFNQLAETLKSGVDSADEWRRSQNS